jgi:hypothetical protein
LAAQHPVRQHKHGQLARKAVAHGLHGLVGLRVHQKAVGLDGQGLEHRGAHGAHEKLVVGKHDQHSGLVFKKIAQILIEFRGGHGVSCCLGGGGCPKRGRTVFVWNTHAV